MRNSRLQIVFLINMFILPILCIGQELGIRFESGLSWSEVKAKAMAENKPIFIDCYATWCGPCKGMDKNIYTQKAVGDYFNTHFINVKMQMDKTSKDSKYIQDWYFEAISFRDVYKISAYPTFLVLSPGGKPLHLFVGASYEGSGFIARASDALDSNRQYFTLLGAWENHKKDSAFLLHALIAAKGAGDNESIKTMSDFYINCVNTPTSREVISILDPLITKENDKGFALYLRNVTNINNLMGKVDFVEKKLSGVIFDEEIKPLFFNGQPSINWGMISENMVYKYSSLSKNLLLKHLDESFKIAIFDEINDNIEKMNDSVVDWIDMSRKLKLRFPGYDCRETQYRVEVYYYLKRKSWDECAKAAIELNDQRIKQVDMADAINEWCWAVIFLHSNEKVILRKAIKQMKTILRRHSEDQDYLDTYANLLYKAGYKKRAIYWEGKAMLSAGKNKGNDNIFKLTLAKMEKGQSTWDGRAG